MITKLTGRLVELGTDELTLAVGPLELEVRIADFTRRQLQSQLGREITLYTISYLEGSPVQGRLLPRVVGFYSPVEREFFELFCSVDGVGVKKALRAMVRPVNEVATAVEEQDVKTLSSLPGVGAALAERIVAKLRRKMSKFALLVAREVPGEASIERSVIEETFEVLRSLGHSEGEARKLIDAAIATKQKYSDVQSLLQAIYQQSHKK